MKIVIPEFIDEAAIHAGLAGFDVIYDPKLVDDPARLAGLVGDADALIVRNRTEVRGDLLAAARRVTCIGRLGVGLDNIDMEACAARGIAVFPATGANTGAVAEYVIASAMLLLRGAYAASSRVVAGEWPRNALMGREIAGKCLGLVGFGSIARETARRAAALGMHLVGHDPLLAPDDPAWRPGHGRVVPLSLADLLACADVVSLHVPLMAATRGLIDAGALARMKPDAILINSARGGIVDDVALIAALREGRLGGAALDVFDGEPLDAATGARFRDVPNLLLTPHIAGVTQEANVRVAGVTIEAVRRHLGDRTIARPDSL